MSVTDDDLNKYNDLAAALVECINGYTSTVACAALSSVLVEIAIAESRTFNIAERALEDICDGILDELSTEWEEAQHDRLS